MIGIVSAERVRALPGVSGAVDLEDDLEDLEGRATWG
jgi:hypothetical protein